MLGSCDRLGRRMIDHREASGERRCATTTQRRSSDLERLVTAPGCLDQSVRRDHPDARGRRPSEARSRSVVERRAMITNRRGLSVRSLGTPCEAAGFRSSGSLWGRPDRTRREQLDEIAWPNKASEPCVRNLIVDAFGPVHRREECAGPIRNRRCSVGMGRFRRALQVRIFRRTGSDQRQPTLSRHCRNTNSVRTVQRRWRIICANCGNFCDSALHVGAAEACCFL